MYIYSDEKIIIIVILYSLGGNNRKKCKFTKVNAAHDNLIVNREVTREVTREVSFYL